MTEKLEPGYYWVRMKAASNLARYEPRDVLIMELSETGKWYICGIDFAEDEAPEVLSHRLEPPAWSA